MMCEMADILLSKRGDTQPQSVGINWVYHFVKRSPVLSNVLAVTSARYHLQRKCLYLMSL